MSLLREKQAQLQEVEDQIQELQDLYESSVNEKEELCEETFPLNIKPAHFFLPKFMFTRQRRFNHFHLTKNLVIFSYFLFL